MVKGVASSGLARPAGDRIGENLSHTPPTAPPGGFGSLLRGIEISLKRALKVCVPPIGGLVEYRGGFIPTLSRVFGGKRVRRFATKRPTDLTQSAEWQITKPDVKRLF